MKVEIFSSESIYKAQESINNFFEVKNVKVISIDTKATLLHDLHYSGEVCNQWIEYVTTILYNE